ncbi:flagellar hook-associated protein 3 [Rheinheimera riviphila]|uniref:Flagellar hook-associated protein 3 n=1 Tax=Rheinheimera riviphila TaxID=1834037 RepID=A0A437QJ80_9GAMM|nr:flagellar hook-associated protein FlgL [Rheinheimera riviphila]RVU34554.1 flagellar hook-associated protein 3 [Rheinheimera riviphila]
MRISFNQKYEQSLSAILRAQDKLLTASAQLEKQTKILTPADDPSGSARVVALDQQITQTDQYQANSIGLKNSLNIEETVLSGIRKSMDQARLLTVSLGSGAYSQLDRSAVAKQLENIRAEIFDLMNQKDANGGYLFSGFQEQTQSYSLDVATGYYQFNGDEGQKSLQVSPTVALPSNDSGKNIFEDVNARNKTTAPVAGGGVASAKIVVKDQSAFDQFYLKNYDGVTAANNNYRVQIAAGNTYEVFRNGASLTPAVTGSFVPGEPISFKGLTITANGAAPGTVDFSLPAPRKSNILNTLTDIINSVEKNSESGDILAEKIADTLVQIDSAALKVDGTVSAIGGRQNSIDNIFDSNEDLQLSNKKYRADIYEVDYASAITELTKQETALEAVQATFNKVTGTSLFDYIR